MGFIARRGFDWVLVAMGIAAVFCMIGPVIALVAAISIVGLPITFLMAITAPAFFFLLTVRLAMFAFPFRGGWIAAVAVAATVFTAAPWLINQRLDETARALAAGDLNTLDKPFSVRSLAVVSGSTFFNRDQTRCDDFCQRALLSGALDRVLVATDKDQSLPLDTAADAVSFRMEQRDTCPAVSLQPGVNGLDIDRGSASERPAGPDELMRLQIAAGNCLVEEPAIVADAEAIVRIGRIKKGDTPYSAGLKLFADTVRADRIALWQRDGGGFTERYRWTGVETYKLLPVLLPSYVTGYGFEIANGFLRRLERINIAEKYYEAPNRTAFFTQTLGLDLKPDATSVDELRTAALNQRLAAPGNLDAVSAQVAGDFFDDIAIRSKMTEEQAEQGLRVIADARIPVPRAAYVLARYGETLPVDVQRRIGDVLVDRLLNLTQPEGNKRSAWVDEASSLGGAIRMLPASAVASHRPALEQLARRELLRVPAWQALVRLSDFGADAVPTLLYLIDDAERFRDSSGNDWQHPYLAGLIGICTLGKAGNAAAEPLFARIDGGRMPMHASYGDLMINTLVGIGAPDEAIWQRVLAADPKAERKHFDRIASRARKKPDCSY